MSHNPAEHPADTRAVAMAELLRGQSVNEVARKYSIPKGTVSDWKRMAFKEAGREPDNPTQNDQRGVIGELLTEYLEGNLRALRVHTELFSDRQWLEKQDAQQIAVLHGIMTDKAVRLLEAISAGGEG